MTEEIDFHLDVAKEQMQEAISHLENVLGKIRAVYTESFYVSLFC